MTMSISFLLLVSRVLLFEDVYCFDDFSPPKILVPSDTIRNGTNIDWKDMHDKNSHNFQSYINLEKYKKEDRSLAKSKWKLQRDFIVKFLTESPNMLKLQFQRNSIFQKCNFSRPLHLSFNGLDNLSPDEFDKLNKLARLLLEHNNLDSLNVTISQDSDFLESLKIDMNNLFILAREIFHDLKNLKTITLNRNNFSAIPANLFDHNKRVKTIELKENKVNLTDLPPRIFSSLVDLKVVLLRNIGLHQLMEDLFWGSHNPKEIDLSNNYLQVLPEKLLRDSHELRIFNASSNHLTTLPSGIFIATNKLIQLDLSYNCITALNSSDLFFGLHSLEILHMENNNLKFIHANAFIALRNLKIAYFSGNHLNLTTGLYDSFGQVSPFRHCHFIEELHLSSNVISEIFSDWVLNHTKLRKLDLSENKLRYLEANDLRFNSSDLYVDLSHNNIETVNLTQLQNIPKKANSSRNVVIDLNWNPIYCNCDIYSLVRYLMNETSDWLKLEDLNYVKLKTDNLYCASYYKWKQRINQLSIQVLSCGAYEMDENRLSSCPRYCFCQIIPKFNMLKIDCANSSRIVAPNWINTWHINFAYVDLSDNALQRTPEITVGGYEIPRELYLDLSGNQIDRIEENFASENLRGLLLDDNKLTETDMEFVKLKAPKAITKGIREKSWPCDPAIWNYQRYAIDRFTLKKSIDWAMNKFMCPVKTVYFTEK